MKEIPTLSATRVSMLALPCFNCFQAFLKKRLPHPNTTGVERRTRKMFLHNVSLKPMDTSMTITAAAMLAKASLRRVLNSFARMRSASSSRSKPLTLSASASSETASSSSSGTTRS